MAFAVDDVQGLVRLLDEQPEWRAEIRRRLLSDELLAMPEQLAEQRRDIGRIEQEIAEQRLDLEGIKRELAEQRRDIGRIEQEIAEQRLELQGIKRELAEQRRDIGRIEQELAEQRRDIGRIEQEIAEQRRDIGRIEQEIAEQRRDIQRIEQEIVALRRDHEKRFQQIEQELAQLRRDTDQRFRQVEDQIAALTRTVETLTNDVGELKGDSLERRYREKTGAYFGRLLRRSRVMADAELNDLLDDAVQQGVLSEDESNEVAWADAIVRGRRRGDRTEVVAVAEVSWGVGCRDVERARRRADLVAKLGFTTMAVVGGKAVTREAAEMARQHDVWQLFDGRAVAPDVTADSR